MELVFDDELLFGEMCEVLELEPEEEEAIAFYAEEETLDCVEYIDRVVIMNHA